MSRPYKEVIIYDTIDGSTNQLLVTNTTSINLKQSGVRILWRGSKEKFKRDFEIPNDAPLSTKDTKLTNGNKAQFVTNWDWTTLNFKLNYQVWYKDGASTNTGNKYVNGSNNTINLTIPNVLVFDGNSDNNNYIIYSYTSGAPQRAYNPNVFPLPISIVSFVTSNKVDDWQVITGSGNDSLSYLVFRYGVSGDDIQICLLTKNNNAFQVNSQPLIIPYISLTFTGFNKVKRL